MDGEGDGWRVKHSGLEGQVPGTVSRGQKVSWVHRGKELLRSSGGKRATWLGVQEAGVRKGDWSSEESQGTGKQEEGSWPGTLGTRNVKPPDLPHGSTRFRSKARLAHTEADDLLC